MDELKVLPRIDGLWIMAPTCSEEDLAFQWAPPCLLPSSSERMQAFSQFLEFRAMAFRHLSELDTGGQYIHTYCFYAVEGQR